MISLLVTKYCFNVTEAAGNTACRNSNPEHLDWKLFYSYNKEIK